MPEQASWVRIVGDGVAYLGPCLVLGFVMVPDAIADYADIYDGKEATSGKKFCRCISAIVSAWAITLPIAVPFSEGIYVDGKDSAVETTVIFMPL